MNKTVLFAFIFSITFSVYAQKIDPEASYFGKNFRMCSEDEKPPCIDSAAIISKNFGEIKSHKEGWLTSRGTITNTVSAFVIRSRTDERNLIAIVFLEDFQLENGERSTCHACSPTQFLLVYETSKDNQWVLTSSNRSDKGAGSWGFLFAQNDSAKQLIYSDNKDNFLIMIYGSDMHQGVVAGGYEVYFRNKRESDKTKKIKSMGQISTHYSSCGGFNEKAIGYDSQLVVRYSKKQYYPEIKLFKTNYNQCNTASDFETQQEETYVFDDKSNSYKKTGRVN